MKKSTWFLAFMLALIVVSCNQNRKNNSEQTGNASDLNDQCYRALYETDSAFLSMKTLEDGKVRGTLFINFGELKPNALENVRNKGEIAGRFRGDTLFVDYTYTSGTINKTVFKNPLAFLKKGDKLILGVGDIETYMGRSYFITDKPINFDIARFQFEPVACKE